MHSRSAMMLMMQTTTPVLTGSGPTSKEGRAGGERLAVCSFDPSPVSEQPLAPNRTPEVPLFAESAYFSNYAPKSIIEK
ncbi:hypothetical protein BDN67DRAFT_647056 [Paxillus ammoniavirescens]|nr:hypothetical protein BDN67DRAFT_647056 [Paxillus ammoniavirescens]